MLLFVNALSSSKHGLSWRFLHLGIATSNGITRIAQLIEDALLRWPDCKSGFGVSSCIRHPQPAGLLNDAAGADGVPRKLDVMEFRDGFHPGSETDRVVERSHCAAVGAQVTGLGQTTMLPPRMYSRRNGFRSASFSTRSIVRPLIVASSSCMRLKSHRLQVAMGSNVMCTSTSLSKSKSSRSTGPNTANSVTFPRWAKSAICSLGNRRSIRRSNRPLGCPCSCLPAYSRFSG